MARGEGGGAGLQVIRIFLSLPGSADGLADLAEATIAEAFANPAWKDTVVPVVGRWNEKDRVCSWSMQQAPNDAIFDRQGAPQDADLFVVLLTSTIGPGTIDEVRDRCSAGREVARTIGPGKSSCSRPDCRAQCQ